MRNLLQELGSPEDIVAAALVEGPAPAAAVATGGASAGPWGAVEISAVLGLTVGAFLLPVVGPLAGIVLVRVSARWTKPEKVVATVLTSCPCWSSRSGLPA